MNTIHLKAAKCLAAALLGASGLALFASAAQAADSAGRASSQSKYEQDVANCNSGKTGQESAACLREAGAARDAANRQTLGTASDDELQRNALARCNALPEASRPDCLAKMTSSDTVVTGSVQGGGVLREKTIQVPVGTPGSTPSR